VVVGFAAKPPMGVHHEEQVAAWRIEIYGNDFLLYSRKHGYFWCTKPMPSFMLFITHHLLQAFFSQVSFAQYIQIQGQDSSNFLREYL
jgi:hypothetical protein